MENLEKRPVSATIRAMKIGDVEIFPKSQNRSVSAVSSTISYELDTKYSKERKPDFVTITRLA